MTRVSSKSFKTEPSAFRIQNFYAHAKERRYLLLLLHPRFYCRHRLKIHGNLENKLESKACVSAMLTAGGAIQRKNVLSPGTSRKIGTIGACHGSPHVTHDPPINPLPSTARSLAAAPPLSLSFLLARPPAACQHAPSDPNLATHDRRTTDPCTYA